MMIQQVNAFTSITPFQIQFVNGKIRESYEFNKDYHQLSLSHLFFTNNKDKEHIKFVKLIVGKRIVQAHGRTKDGIGYVNLVNSYSLKYIWLKIEATYEGAMSHRRPHNIEVVESNHEIIELEMLSNDKGSKRTI